MKTKLLFTLVAVSTIAGCRCGPGNNSGLVPDFSVSPTALEFQACPTKDEAGMAVLDVFPAEEKVNVRNNAKVSGPLQLSFAGDDKAAFSLAPGFDVATLAATAEQDVPIRFSPARKGDLRAELHIDDGAETTDPLVVTLIGVGKNLAANPRLEVAPQDKDTLQPVTCQDGLLCQAIFPDTLQKESVTLDVKLRNKGCPAMKITGLEVLPYGSGSTNLAFFIDQPALPPSAATPLVLTEGVDNGETTLKVRFAPESDGSSDTQRFAILRVKSNDPANPEFDISLFGNAIEPSIYATPSFCDYTNGPCGAASPGATSATFTLTNGGNGNIKIDSVTFASSGNGTSGSNGRFTIATSIVGQSIAPAATLNLTVGHLDQPLYVIDQVTVSASVVGSAVGSAGRVVITVAGGKLPCLETEPVDTLSFENPATELSAKAVTIRNKNDAACGDLILGEIGVDASPFFSIIDPTAPKGTRLAPGASSTATVQYKKPVSGGTQAGVLRIPSNDPDYPATGRVLYLYSNAPLNQLPVAVVEGCKPPDTACATPLGVSMSVNLSQLSPKQLTITGKNSYDPGNPTQPGITKWQFRLVRRPTNATNASLANDGVKIAQNQTTLTLDPGALGLYQVTLVVTDDTGQDSAIAGDLKINVNQ